MVQALQPTDLQSRLAYAVHIQQLAREHYEFIHKLIMSDKAHFHLNETVNKQNCQIWAIENPRTVHQRELHTIKCTVRVIGPYFFEDKEGVTVMVTAQCYQQLKIVYGQLFKATQKCDSNKMERLPTLPVKVWHS